MPRSIRDHAKISNPNFWLWQSTRADFGLELSGEGWYEVEGKLEPVESAMCAGINWLADGDAKLLISHDGSW